MRNIHSKIVCIKLVHLPYLYTSICVSSVPSKQPFASESIFQVLYLYLQRDVIKDHKLKTTILKFRIRYAAYTLTLKHSDVKKILPFY